ncbi:flavodoxin/nitric oxide synthase [Isoptericola sp. S6320L]|uniref:flavodoxin family protein n=1 Tax=Isoptericola sp. S6320L TaxID=2926411 RepID=UPI001FF3B57F|nr:flavodoxin/nitric oxide synthase [Isoptericola sp. S6320L]MCK0118560.1 flavodoxin/nitric oxide synthase [Isoptericola sp. S6320L]
MSALVVYESGFGNTALVARSVGDGIGTHMPVRVASVSDLEVGEAGEADLVVIGGPTHAFGMSRPQTRQEGQVQRGDEPSETAGIREWIDALPSDRGVHLFATFDTRVERVRHLPGSAAHAAARALRHDGHRVVDRGASFYVAGVTGPLVPHERERAREWGERLARRAQEMLLTA